MKPVSNTALWQPKLYKNKVIQLGAQPALRRTNVYLAQVELNEITEVVQESERIKIELKYPLTTDLKTGFNQGSDPRFDHPVLIEVVDNPGITTVKNINLPNFVAKNVVIRDLILSQAQADITHSPPLPLPKVVTLRKGELKAPSSVIKGSAFDGKFFNIATTANVGIPGGNMMNRSEFSYITIKVGRKLLDLGFASANLTIHDLNWTYFQQSTDAESGADRSLVYVDSGDHDITAYNISVSGSWSGRDLININSGANQIQFHDWTIDLPQHNSPNRNALTMNDRDNPLGVHDIFLKDISIRVSSVALFGAFGLKDQTSHSVPHRNIQLTNVTFRGNAARSPSFQRSAGFRHLDFSGVTANGKAVSAP